MKRLRVSIDVLSATKYVATSERPLTTASNQCRKNGSVYNAALSGKRWIKQSYASTSTKLNVQRVEREPNSYISTARLTKKEIEMSYRSARKREQQRMAQQESDHYESGSGSWVDQYDQQGEAPVTSRVTDESLNSHEHRSRDEVFEALVEALEAEAARRAYAAGLGASEWEAFLWPEARAVLKLARSLSEPARDAEITT